MYYLVYGLLWLISLLPFRVLYFLSDVFYGLIYYVIGYRKKIVMSNLQIAFPEINKRERIQIAKKFYHNLVDNFIESIKLITISNKAFSKRCTADVSELNRIASTGKNIQLHCGHQFNWEYANKIYSQKLAARFVLVYMPVGNKIMNRLFFKIRQKDGTALVNAANYAREMLGVYKQTYVLGLVADQNPAMPASSFWLNFFSRPTPFLYTSEKNAIRNNNAVVFLSFKKLKRGYYKCETIVITENAAETKTGELTKKYRDFLQQRITEQPDNYLWSHRRWKNEYKPEYEKRWID